MPVLRRRADQGSGRRGLCAGVHAAGAWQLRPHLHRRVHEPVRIHDAHRQLLLLRGLPEVYPPVKNGER